mmetsp:Transcript_37864/g.91270  ORF Transcript_37864/g.91270 Transcript_37864/m.91270 type:complete len:256 (-) Transcript_37864:821-1588(-)
MMLASSAYRSALSTSRRPVCSFLSGLPSPYKTSGLAVGNAGDNHDGRTSSRCAPYSTILSAAAPPTPTASLASNLSSPKICVTKSNRTKEQTIRAALSSSSFSNLPPDEEQAEKIRVDSLTPYQKEMELRQLDSEIARLQTLHAINTGDLYTYRGRFKILSRDYGMGFLVWWTTVWAGTAGLSYLAIEWGGVDPLMVAAKAENFLGLEPMSISGRLDPALGKIGLAIAMNECLEPLRLPFVVVTTKPVVNFFRRR